MGSKHQQLTKSVSEVMDMDMRQANLAYYCTNEIIVFKLHGLNGKTVDFTVPLLMKKIKSRLKGLSFLGEP